MNMIIAVNNKKIEDALIKIYAKKYQIYIVNTKDIIITMIQDIKTVLILRDDLIGQTNTTELLDELKKYKKLITIMIVKNVDNSTKEKLYSREIFNIIDGKKLKIQDLIAKIDNPLVLENVILEKSIKSNIIFVIGNNGTGKTSMSIILAKYLGIDSNKKVLVIDMDYINPNLDLYIDGTKNYSFVDYIKDVKSSNLKEIKNYETIDEKNSNIRYLLNQKGIGIPSDEITLQLFQAIKSDYDVIIVDTSPFLIDKMYDLAVKLKANIIYMIEPNIQLFKNINKKILYNSIVVLNIYRKDRDIYKYVRKNIDFPISETLKRNVNLSKDILNGNKKIKFKNISKELNIANYTLFQKIIKKIVFKEKIK